MMWNVMAVIGGEVEYVASFLHKGAAEARVRELQRACSNDVDEYWVEADEGDDDDVTEEE